MSKFLWTMLSSFPGSPTAFVSWAAPSALGLRTRGLPDAFGAAPSTTTLGLRTRGLPDAFFCFGAAPSATTLGFLGAPSALGLRTRGFLAGFGASPSSGFCGASALGASSSSEPSRSVRLRFRAGSSSLGEDASSSSCCARRLRFGTTGGVGSRELTSTIGTCVSCACVSSPQSISRVPWSCSSSRMGVSFTFASFPTRTIASPFVRDFTLVSPSFCTGELRPLVPRITWQGPTPVYLISRRVLVAVVTVNESREMQGFLPVKSKRPTFPPSAT